MNVIDEYDLQFGLLALRMFFVDGEQLVQAINAWEDQQSRELSEVLIEHGAMTADERELVSSMLPARNASLGNASAQGTDAVGSQLDYNNPDQTLPLSSVPVVTPVARPGPQNPLPQNPDDTLLSGSQTAALGGQPLSDSWIANSARPELPPGSMGQNGLPAKERFEHLRPHAKGALGEVFLALDGDLRREVAVKEILDECAQDAQHRARFVFEAEITGALEHPGIVPIYALGQRAGGKPYYAMRFIEGTSMEAAVKKFHARGGCDNPANQMLLRDLLGQMVDVCNTMGYAHSRDIIHRDLKPENVMLGRYGETLVVDWGLAKRTFSPDMLPGDSASQPPAAESTDFGQTQMGQAMGTPFYMSPEQSRGRHDLVDARSDIYSLGATLYKILTARPACTGKTLAEVMDSVQSGKFAKPRQIASGIPKPLEAICLKALALDPANRYQTATEMGVDLENWMADEPVGAFPEPITARCRRWMRRHKSVVGSAAIALASIMAVLSISVVLLTQAYQTAERNRKQARAAVDQYFTVVSEDTLLGQPGMENLRTELLNQALVYYRGFLSEEQGSSLAREIALTKYYVGQITEKDADALNEAIALYEEAAQIQKQLLADASDNALMQSELANTLNALGRANDKKQAPAIALAYFREALDIRQQLSLAAPDSGEYQRKLANAIMNIGWALEGQEKYAEARETIQSAQAIRRKTGDASNRDLRRDLAKGDYALAMLNLNQGDIEAASGLLTAAADIMAQLVQEDPEDLADAASLGVFQQLLGDLQFEIYGFEGAGPLYAKSAAAFESLVYQIPGVAEYQFRLANVYMNIGESYLDDLAYLLEQNQYLPSDAQFALASLDQAETILRSLQSNFGKGKIASTKPAGRDQAIAARRQEFADNLARVAEVRSELISQLPAASTTEESTIELDAAPTPDDSQSAETPAETPA